MTPTQSIAQRSVTSVSWNVIGNIATVAIGFVRTVLLARWLPVEVFGVCALAGSIIALSGVLANFGMGGAFLNRVPETEDEEMAAAVHFTLKSSFTLLWAAVLVAGALVFLDGQSRLALLVLAGAAAGTHLTQTPRLILARRVIHRRLALIQLVDAVLSTLIALGLAYLGAGLWALLASSLVSTLLDIVFVYLWQPIWRPRLAWSPEIARYFLRFGRVNLLSGALAHALDRVDDLWTGVFLGEFLLGYYSRAYSFATYPRAILAEPINLVATGTYAELKGQRVRLSEAFVFVNSFLIRSGFFLAALIALVAPEFIRIVLGERWLPMLDAFRLMLVFTLFDPMKTTVANLFIAMGEPHRVVRVRSAQLAVLVAGLFLLGPWLGIAGVALAVDAMLIIGISVLLYKARDHVDFSVARLFAAPGLALTIGLLLAYKAGTSLWAAGNDWRSGAVKTVVFSAVYGISLLGLEHRQLPKMVSAVARHIIPRAGTAPFDKKPE
jgi:O-antigen/teichoic acid export membrane protein